MSRCPHCQKQIEQDYDVAYMTTTKTIVRVQATSAAEAVETVRATITAPYDSRDRQDLKTDHDWQIVSEKVDRIGQPHATPSRRSRLTPSDASATTQQGGRPHPPPEPRIREPLR